MAVSINPIYMRPARPLRSPTKPRFVVSQEIPAPGIVSGLSRTDHLGPCRDRSHRPACILLLMMCRPLLRAIVACAIAGLFAAWCSACGLSDPSNNKSDTFSGTVPLGGTGPLHTFTVSKNGGEFNIKITSLSPDSGTTLGMRYGQFTSSTDCIAINQTGIAALNKTAFSGPISKGDFCAVVFDNGLITRAETYTITVSHP